MIQPHRSVRFDTDLLLNPSTAWKVAVDDAGGEALTLLDDTERHGGIWEGKRTAQEDLALLQALLPPEVTPEDAATGFRILFDTERTQSVDPTYEARRTLKVLGPTLRSDESFADAASHYATLYKFENHRDIGAATHAREAWQRIDKARGPLSRSRVLEIYTRDPEHFEEKAREACEQWEARQAANQASLERAAHALAAPPPAPIETHDEWIVVGDVTVRRRPRPQS